MTVKRTLKRKAKPRGRPPIRYDSELHPAFAKALAIDGLTNEEIARKLGCSEDTLRKWSKLYPEFSGALKEGKESADAKVEMSLYKRACGYDVLEEKALNIGGELLKTKVLVHIHPDPVSCFFWLKNRRPDKWRDKQEIEHSGTIQIVIDKDDAEL
jgi:transposase